MQIKKNNTILLKLLYKYLFKLKYIIFSKVTIFDLPNILQIF